MDVIVVIERLQKGTDFRPLVPGQFRTLLRHITQLTGHHRPPMIREPLGHAVRVGALRDEPRAGRVRRNVIVLLVGEGLDFVGPA